MIDVRNKRWESLVCAGFAGAFLVFIFLYATEPIADPDFGWHLKSGELMVKNGGLLQSDPFNFTGDGVVSARESLILKGYWLWQLLAYGLYSLFASYGIYLLNFLTVLAMAGVVTWQMYRQRVDYALAVVLMTLGFSLLRFVYLLERPQMVSFVFAALLVGLLARVREGGKLGWPLPLLMLVWANMHGGFVVGDLSLLCFAAGAVLEYRQDLPCLRRLLGWTALGFGASLLNPNGILVFSELFTFFNSALMKGVLEFQSTWLSFSKGMSSVLILWLLIALYCLGVWNSRRFYWPELFVTIFLAWFSAAYMRNVAFFAVAMLPVIGCHLQQPGRIPSWSLPPFWKYIVVLTAAVALLWQVCSQPHGARKESLYWTYSPAGATQFILTSGVQGKMFNAYDYGGYLLWKLFPQHRVFIDTRGLDTEVYLDWKKISAASLDDVGGRKEYEVLLDRYAIDYVVQSHVYFDNGRLAPLLKFLLVKPEWIPVYVDTQSFIFVRQSPKNAAVIARYRLDKHDFNNKIIGYLTALYIDRPTEVIIHVALSEMLIFVGRYAEAEKHLAIIARLQPGNADLPSLRNQLAVLKTGKKS